MGASCCRPIQDNNESRSKAVLTTSGSRSSLHLQSSRSGRTPAPGNQNSSSLNGRFTRRLHSGYFRRHQKIRTVQAQQQQVAPVTAEGHSNQASYEPSNILKSFKDKNASSNCNIEIPPTSPKETKSDSFLLPITDDEDFCPTCLEGYEKDNPKILTKCKHHYHLACILEWMERSNTCPICDQEMIIEEANDTTADS